VKNFKPRGNFSRIERVEFERVEFERVEYLSFILALPTTKEMNIACNECRQRLSDALDETANPAAHNALTEHLAACPSCRAELDLLRAARDELRAFPTLAAPGTLRAGIRAELEDTAPSAAPAFQPAADSKIITAPAHIMSKPDSAPRRDWREPEPTRWQSWNEKFRTFLRNPTNITWASCCILLLFYFISLSRQPKPSGQFRNVERAPIGEPYQKRFHDDNGEMPIYQSPYRNNPYFKPLPKQAEPGKPPQWAPPNLPGNALPAPGETPAAQTPGAKPSSSGSARDTASADKEPAPEKPAARPAPPASKPGNNSNSGSDSSARMRASRPAPARNDDDGGSSASLPAPAPAVEKPRSNYMARSTPEDARGPSGPPAAMSAKRDSAEFDETIRKDENRKSAAATREVTTRLTPPRTIGWAQISVVLSGGARFPDGQKSRVIWRGAAQANEPIELNFSVQSGAGGDAKITLQEVKNGQAQTVAYKNVAVAAAR
jgi:hypothetical protein